MSAAARQDPHCRGVWLAYILCTYRVHTRSAVFCGVVLAVLAALSGCAVGHGSYRDTDVPISATSRFTPARFDGTWHVIAGYPNAFLPSCPGQTWQIMSDPGSIDVTCGSGDRPVLSSGLGVDPRGVLRVQTSDLDSRSRAFWVLWMDEEGRLAAIGTPGGEMGWVVSRSTELRADRLAAATAILEFNGYDTGPLKSGEP